EPTPSASPGASMTVTEDAPAAVSAPSAPPAATPASSGLAAILGSGDHKVIGRLWIVASLAHLVLVGAAALAVAVEKIDTSSVDVISTDWFAQIFAYRSIAGAFLVLLPLTIGVATAIVPLQLGAPTLAFPRAAAAAAWAYLLGGGLVVGAFAIHGGPGGTDRDGVRLFIVAFALVLVAEIVAWICIATTVIAVRVPGLSLVRTPLFAWSALIAGAVWVFTLPILLGVVILGYLDVRYGGSSGFFGGGNATLYARIAWAFGTPAVYAFAIPVLGIIGSFVPVFTSTRHQQHRMAQGLIGAFGVLSVGAWAMPGFGQDAFPWLYELPWIAVSVAIVVPLLGLFGLWALTAQRGKVSLSSPLLFGLTAGVMLLVGLLAGAAQAIKPIKTLVDGPGTSLYGTTWSTSVSSYVVLATAIALLGGIVYWAPKILGRSFAEGPARGVALGLLAGTVLWSFPDLVAGLLGQSAAAGVAPADNVSTIEALNTASTIGGVVLALGVAGFVALMIRAARSDELPGDDPWGGHTLEWATSSPPPVGNFASIPEIASEAPLYDARHRTEEGSA
ncbi:MAG: cbb3-type cytochrome c oxidase subunit I, partial [Acidimicrobiales bacterium]